MPRTFVMPPTLKVGFATYKFVAMTAEECDVADHVGITDNNQQVMRINLDGSEARVVNTCVHESFHAMWDQGDLGEEEPEEKAVSVLANQLCLTMRDNPEFWHNVIDSLVKSAAAK